MKGNYAPANVREILPEIVAASIEEGIRCFDQNYKDLLTQMHSYLAWKAEHLLRSEFPGILLLWKEV